MSRCYLGIVAIVRDEQDLREWVAYHRAIGVEKFWIYDNESVERVDKVLRDYVKQGWVRVFRIHGRCRQCAGAYRHAIRHTRDKAEWVAFIDADEFLLPHSHDDIKEWLAARAAASAIGVNWQIFGNNGHVERPPGLVMENYIRRAEVAFAPNQHVKTIARPLTLRCARNPHCFKMRGDHTMLNPDGRPIAVSEKFGQAFQVPPAVESIQINHYFTRSFADFKLKQARRGGNSGRPRATETFHRYNAEANRVVDPRILRHLERTKAIL